MVNFLRLILRLHKLHLVLGLRLNNLPWHLESLLHKTLDLFLNKKQNDRINNVENILLFPRGVVILDEKPAGFFSSFHQYYISKVVPIKLFFLCI